MKKSILSVLFIGILVIGLTGCGKNNSNNVSNNEANNVSEDSKQTTSKRTDEYVPVGNVNIKYGTYKKDDGTTFELSEDGTAKLNGENYYFNVKSNEVIYDSVVVPATSQEELENRTWHYEDVIIIKDSDGFVKGLYRVDNDGNLWDDSHHKDGPLTDDTQRFVYSEN